MDNHPAPPQTLTVRSKAITSRCSLHQQTTIKRKKKCFSDPDKMFVNYK